MARHFSLDGTHIDDELIVLGARLKAAIGREQRKIAAIPVHYSVWDEMAAIERALRRSTRIVSMIAASVARSEAGRRVKEFALAYMAT